jgi:hypothetical protein
VRIAVAAADSAAAADVAAGAAGEVEDLAAGAAIATDDEFFKKSTPIM